MIRRTAVATTLALAPALALLACSSGSGGSDNQPAPVALVSLATATTGHVDQTLTLYGSVQKDSSAQYALSVPVEATVRDIPRPVGSRVGAGDVVARLSPSPSTRASMVKAGADARTAQQAYARAKRLRADGLASDADVESARAAAEGAQAQAAAMSRSAGELTLRARAAGQVESVPVNPGDLLSPGATVATLTRSGSQRVGFGIDPDAAAKLSPGTPITVRTGSGTPITVPIENVSLAVDPQTRLATVYARLPASAGIGPGQSLAASVPLATSNAALTIPYAALLDDGGQPYVYVVSDGVAHRHDVVTGPSSGQRIAIEKGVKPGDKVVTNGGTALEDGMKVRTK